MLVTQGRAGGLLVEVGDAGPAHVWHYRSSTSDREDDPTGAGDTFLAALAASVLRPAIVGRGRARRTPDLRFAAAAGSLVVEGPGLEAVPDRAAVLVRRARERVRRAVVPSEASQVSVLTAPSRESLVDPVEADAARTGDPVTGAEPGAAATADGAKGADRPYSPKTARPRDRFRRRARRRASRGDPRLHATTEQTTRAHRAAPQPRQPMTEVRLQGRFGPTEPPPPFDQREAARRRANRLRLVVKPVLVELRKFDGGHDRQPARTGRQSVPRLDGLGIPTESTKEVSSFRRDPVRVPRRVERRGTGRNDRRRGRRSARRVRRSREADAVTTRRRRLRSPLRSSAA